MLKTTVKRGSFTNIGILSLLTVFVVLCLTAFGALSLATAYADLRTARKYGETVAAYYTAESASQRVIAALEAEGISDETAEKYGIVLHRDSEADSLIVSYEIMIGEGPNRLSVTLELYGDELRCLRHCVEGDGEEAENGFYELIS